MDNKLAYTGPTPTEEVAFDEELAKINLTEHDFSEVERDGLGEDPTILEGVVEK